MTDLHTNIMIFYTPRSGSTVLCECMGQAKVFGKASAFYVGNGPLLKTEFIPNAQQWLDDHAFNGVHVTKAPFNYFDRISRRTRPDPVVEFLDSFTHFIILGRRNVVAQAVSWHLASETAAFTSKSSPPKRDGSRYNYLKILWFYSFCYGKQQRGHTFAHASGKSVMNLYYEDFENDLAGAVKRIAEWVGLEIDPAFIAQPSYQKQRDPLKAEYIQRFTEDRLARS